MDGLSAVLQAKRFSSSVAEEKHIYHKSLGLPGTWSENLGWWGYGVRWLLPFLALRVVGSWCPSEDYRQKNHGIALQHALVVLKEWSCRDSPQDMGTTVHSALSKAWFTPQASLCKCAPCLQDWSVRISSTRLWDNMTNLHFQLSLTNSTTSPSM